MPVVSHDVLRKFVYDIYRSAGGTEEDARIVSDHVVDSNLAGHDSHGVINAPNYIGGMEGGPATDKMEIVRRWKWLLKRRIPALSVQSVYIGVDMPDEWVSIRRLQHVLA